VVGKNLGISQENVVISNRLLNTMLANESILLMKTMKSHWDIRATTQLALHKLWTDEAVVLAQILNEAAERVRALGGIPFSTAAQMLRNTALSEDVSLYENARVAVDALCADHEYMARELRDSAQEIHDGTNEDLGTVDFLTRTIQIHEGFAADLSVFVEGLTVVVPSPH
jgi:starvation-inducible DNA-binding protein